MRAITVENRGIELLGGMEVDHGGLKESLIGAVFGPAVVPLVDVGPVQCVLAGFELVPLDARVQDVQDVVENLVERESLGFGPFVGGFRCGARERLNSARATFVGIGL
jgi:hypothetical protein